ncbi:MAG: 30S ribosomal protein S19e [Candidatus Micrarchaeota archaeon]
MVTALDVDANALIGNVAGKLKEMKIKKPAFVGIVKTGPHVERPPEQSDFWYMRCASILRKAYADTTIGTNRLRTHYGGRKNRGVRPERHAKAGGSTIRKAMQELERVGLLKKEKVGRTLTGAGRKLLDGAAKDVSDKK